MRHPKYPRYKDFDVAWIDEIPAHWDSQKLKHISSVEFSGVDKHTSEEEVPVRLCNYTDVYYNDYITPDLDFMEATASLDEIENYTLKGSDVVITKDSETWDDIAVPAYVPSDLHGVLCGYHLAMIRPDPEVVEGRYLFRAFSARGLNDQFRVAATGITRYGLGMYWLENSVFLVPPLPQQRAIADFLDRQTAEIDTLIHKQKQLIELLEEKRTALISHAVTRGLDPDVPMKDSGIPAVGRIPSHWRVEKNKYVFNEIDERSTTGEEELLSVSHITGVTPRSEKDVTMFMAETLEGYKCCAPGDLVVNTMWAWMGALGITDLEGIVSPSYHVYRLKKKQNDYCPRYLDFLYRTSAYVCEITRHSKGIWSSRLRLYPDAFFEIPAVSPPVEEQKSIIAYLEHSTGRIDALIDKARAMIRRLQEYRKALISAAVTGKIDVREEIQC